MTIQIIYSGLRDVRGFAVKFYTEDGNWDLTGMSNADIAACENAFMHHSSGAHTAVLYRQ